MDDRRGGDVRDQRHGAPSTSNWNEATATFTVTVARAGTASLSVNTIAADNTVNITEKAAGFSMRGSTGFRERRDGDGGSDGPDGDLLTRAGTGRWRCLRRRACITGTSVTVTVSASKTEFTAPSDVTRTLTVDLTASTAPSCTAPASPRVGVWVTGESVEGPDIASYSATGLPSGLSI